MLTEAKAPQESAGDDPAAKANSAGTNTAQHEIFEHACPAGAGATTKQKERQNAAERQDVQSGAGSTADAVDDGNEEAEVDEAYVMAYLGRHMCPQEMHSAHMSGAACGGTMTPVGVHGDTYVCNMCDFERSESERIAELSRTFQEMSDEAAA